MNVSLTPSQTEVVLADVRADLTARLIADHGDDLNLISNTQAAGILDVDLSTLTKLKIPRVALTPRVIKYRVSDLRAYITANLER